MSVATYYAFDKVLEYFIKKYSTLWEKLDNVFFKTDEINQEIKYTLKELNGIKKKLFDNYIETGHFVMHND